MVAQAVSPGGFACVFPNISTKKCSYCEALEECGEPKARSALLALGFHESPPAYIFLLLPNQPLTGIFPTPPFALIPS